MAKTSPFSMTTSNCFSRALSLSTMSLEHFEALSTASPAPLLAAIVLLMGFHPDNIETHTKEQGERRKKHDLVSRHLYFVPPLFPCHWVA